MTTEPGEERLVADRYLLGGELGRGGMGRVWRAHDRRLNRTVAIKELLLQESLDAVERERLALRMGREAQAAAMGAHPSIVTVHDVLSHDGRPWIVMEFLTGRSLQETVSQDGPQPLERVAAWGVSVLDALDTAHGLGVLHRDVKPANIMITDTGRAVLTDFGIAVIEGESGLTQTHGLIGSPSYLSPERLAFEPASPASDLWALGATLHTSLTGSSPFQRSTLEQTVLAVRREDPPPLGAAASPALAAAVRGLLDKDPAHRMDAREARRLLEAAAATKPSPASDWPDRAPTGPGVPVAAPAWSTGWGGPTAQPPQPPPQPPAPVAPAQWFSWPMAVTVLGAGVLAAVLVGIYVLVPQDTVAPGPGPDTSVVGDAAGTARPPQSPSSAPLEEEENTPEPEPEPEVGPEAGEQVVDPAGFTVRPPQGWQRRVEGDSVYFDMPGGGSYLQIDQRVNQSDDQYRNLVENERNNTTAGTFPDYQRLRLDDVTGEYAYTSTAEWEFTYQSDTGPRHMVTRNITASPGSYYTLAWASPAELWQEQTHARETAFSSFAPN